MAINKTRAVNPITTVRMTSRRPRSPSAGMNPLTIFSLNATDGASNVAEEQLMIADSRAPKKTICATIGVCCTIMAGNTN